MLPVWIIAFSLLGSVGAIVGAALLLAFPSMVRKKLLPYLIGYASGTLLGAAFVGMIPSGLRLLETKAMLMTVLSGLVLFFVLEKLVIWRHCHESRNRLTP